MAPRTRDGGKPEEGFSAWWWLGMPLLVAAALLFCAAAFPRFYAAWIDGEQGLLEIAHIVIPLAGTVVALRILSLRALRSQPLLFGWVLLAAAGCFYSAGEEASWGQHFFRWATPETWQALNDQQETNLHNVSSWFDQKPRTLLELGVIIGGIIVPLVAWRRPELRQGRFAIVLPPALCLPVALLAELFRLPERIADLTGAKAPLLRSSEVQELYFFLFVLFYLIVLHQRLTAAAPAGRAVFDGAAAAPGRADQTQG